MTWFDILKRQFKLPTNLTDGATVDSKSKILNPPPLKPKPVPTKNPKERAKGQTTLNLEEEE